MLSLLLLQHHGLQVPNLMELVDRKAFKMRNGWRSAQVYVLMVLLSAILSGVSKYMSLFVHYTI